SRDSRGRGAGGAASGGGLAEGVLRAQPLLAELSLAHRGGPAAAAPGRDGQHAVPLTAPAVRDGPYRRGEQHSGDNRGGPCGAAAAPRVATVVADARYRRGAR